MLHNELFHLQSNHELLTFMQDFHLKFNISRGSPFQNAIISKERVKIFPTDWCKNYDNRIRNKEVMTF